MKTVEPRSLLTDFPLTVNVSPDLLEIFILWKKNFEEKTGRVPNNVDYMYAGYILANPSVRDQYKDIDQKNIKYKI